MTIQVEGNKLQIESEYLELFEFDATLIGGSTWYYTNTPTGGDNSPILWRGNNYYPLPFEITGMEIKADGTAPSKPTISISNVNQFLTAAVLMLGNLVGTRVTRWRTYYKYTDNGSEPNINMHYPLDQYEITRKLPSALKTVVQFEMSNVLDRPNLKLPRRQILRDLGFPGVSRVRIR